MSENLDSNLYLVAEGQIHLQERGEKDEKGHYTSTNLLCEKTEEIRLRIGVDGTLEGGFTEFSFSQYHTENRETGRVFHTDCEIYLDQNQLTQLHAFLGFLLSIEF